MTFQIETASRALYEANRHGRSAIQLIPALSGCPNCRTVRMIASPATLGSCSDCGADLEVLSVPWIATQAPSAPAQAA
jgi:hypothetical protein